MFKRLISLSLILLSAGCADEIVLDDSGQACLSHTTDWPDGPLVFEANTSFFAIARLHDCLSSSCIEDEQVGCAVEVTGDRIVIDAWASYVDITGAGRTCTDDCFLLAATCETGAIPEGDYTLVYGDDEVPFSLPSATANYCLGE